MGCGWDSSSESSLQGQSHLLSEDPGEDVIGNLNFLLFHLLTYLHYGEFWVSEVP